MPVEIKPWELNPSEKRTEAVAQMLMKVGYEPRRAYQMASKISGFGETVGEFIPGVSHELAEERGDKLGKNLAIMDFIPGGVLAKKAVTPAIRAAIAKQKVKKYQKEGLVKQKEILVKQNLEIKYAKIKELERQWYLLIDELNRVDRFAQYGGPKYSPTTPKGKLVQKKIDAVKAEKRKLTREWKRENKDWVPTRLVDMLEDLDPMYD